MFTLGVEGHSGMNWVNTWPRLYIFRPMSWFLSCPLRRLLARFDAALAARVEHGHEPHLAGISMLKLPRDGSQGGPLALHLVDVATHLLDSGDAGAQEDLVRHVPLTVLD